MIKNVEEPHIIIFPGADAQLIPANPSLSFCWHLRLGFYREVEIARLQSYAAFFYDEFLKHHLYRQAALIAQGSEISDHVVKRVKSNHRRLHRLFEFEQDVLKGLGGIEETLEAHARFERCILAEEPQLFPADKPMGRIERQRFLFDDELAKRLTCWKDKFWELH